MRVSRRIAELVCARKFVFIALLAISTAVSAFFAVGARYGENIYGILPFRNSVLDDYREAAELFGQTRAVFFGVCGNSAEDSSAAAKLLTEKLQGGKLASFPGNGAGEFLNGDFIGALISAFPYIFDSEAESSLELGIRKDFLKRRIEYFKERMALGASPQLRGVFSGDPANILGIWLQKLKKSVSPSDLSAFSSEMSGSSDGRAILIVGELLSDTSDASAARKISERISDTVSEIERKTGAEIFWSGACRIAAENFSTASADSKFCLFLTLAAMLAITFLAFRNVWFAFAAIIPSMLGALFGFACSRCFFAEISPIASAFAGISVGVSIDYAIHVLSRLDIFEKITPKLAAETSEMFARPISVVAGSTLIAFAAMAVLGESGFVQIGVIGGLGITFSALLCVLFLPAFLSGIRLKKSGRSAFGIAVETFYPRLKRLGLRGFCACAILSGLSLWEIQNLNFDGSPDSFNGLGSEAQNDSDKLREIWGGALKRSAIIARGSDMSSALAENSKLSSFLSGIKGIKYYSLAHLLPDASSAGKNFERWKHFWSPQRKADFMRNLKDACAECGVKEAVFSDSMSLADASPTPLDTSKLESIFKGRIACGANGVSILTLVEFGDDADRAAFAKSLSDSFPNATFADADFLSGEISDIASVWLRNFAVATFVLVAIYLFVALGGVKGAFTALTPVAIGLLWTFATMSLIGEPVNMVNAVFVVFAVCLAQDYAVFMIYDYRKNGNCAASLRSTAASALTTAAAFGVLAAAKHPVLSSLGIAAGLSIVFIYAATLLTVPPLLARGEGDGNPNAGWTGRTRGGYWGNFCFLLLLRIGLFPAYVLLVFVAGFFQVFRSGLCVYSRVYLDKLFGEKRGFMPFKLYRLLYSFGMSIIDRVAYFSDSGKICCRDFAEHVVREGLGRGCGVVVLTAHAGGWQISSGELLKYGVEVGLVGAELERSDIRELFESRMRKARPKFIGDSGDASGMLSAYSVLKGGGIVAMHADRYAGGRYVNAEFLGSPLRVPLAPYILAAKSGAALVLVVCFKTGYAEYSMRAIEIPIRKNASAGECAAAAEKFLSELSKALKKHPFQWYNFFDFWGQ